LPFVAPTTHALTFTGGETLSDWEDFIDVLRACCDLLPATAIQVLTNGRAFANSQIVDAWKDIGHPNLMAAIPVYASVDHIHDHVVQARPRDRGIDEGGADMSADILTFPGDGLPDRPISESEIDKLHSEAFRELESSLRDCVRMGEIAANLMSGAKNEDLTLSFAVFHLAEMLMSLEKEYDARWHGERSKP
jgi:hypothetical protein